MRQNLTVPAPVTAEGRPVVFGGREFVEFGHRSGAVEKGGPSKKIPAPFPERGVKLGGKQETRLFANDQDNGQEKGVGSRANGYFLM